MSYFKTSYATLQSLARTGRYENVAGFLVLARHASGLSHAGFEPYKLSGAGVNSIHEKAALSEETARGVVQTLQEKGVIRPATPETRQAFHFARWEIVQGALDLELPHALVDAAKAGNADSALRRLKKNRIAAPGYAEKLTKVSDTELRLDALMLLLGAYRHISMQRFGGLAPHFLRRTWEIKSQSRKLGGVRWGAEPDHAHSSHSNLVFMGECLAHAGQKTKKGDLSDELKVRFWNAWQTLRTLGLFYEAVCLYDADPAQNDEAQLQITVRVNDYHAGAIVKAGDPSLLRSLEVTSGARFAFYTPAENDRGEPEAMWVVLPDMRGALVGVWRPRFRAATRDAGVWIEQEEERIAATVTAIFAAAPAE